MSPQDNPPEVTDGSVALVSSAAPLAKHVVTAQEAASFTDAGQVFDDYGPVIDELRNRVFRSYRQSLPLFIKFHDLIEARPRDGKNRLITPLCGKYTYAEIIEDVTGRKAVTVRAAIAEFKLSPALKDKRKADLRKKRHAKLVAVAQDTQDEAKTAHAVAEEALAGRKVAVETARNEGFADGVAAKRAFTGKQAAANTVTYSFYALFDTSDPLPDGEEIVNGGVYATFAEAQKDLKAYKYGGHGVLKVDAVYTVTPCELPPDEPPVKPFGARRYAAKRRKEALAAATHTPEKFEKEYAAGLAAEAAEAAEACTDCGSKIVAPADGIKHGLVNQCEECGLKVEAETVVGVLIADGKSDYSFQIGLPSEGYGESLKNSQKKLA